MRKHKPHRDTTERDQYGGWTGKKFEATGFFRWHYCGLIDASNLVAQKQDRQHSGLLTGYGEPYPELLKVLKTCTAEMYEVATHRL